VTFGLEPHRGGVGAGVRLGVAHSELDVVLEDLREELLLEEVRPVCDQRLADDPDALADLRATAAGEGLVEDVLVDALSVGASVLLGPGDPEPPAEAGR